MQSLTNADRCSIGSQISIIGTNRKTSSNGLSLAPASGSWTLPNSKHGWRGGSEFFGVQATVNPAYSFSN